MKHTLLHPGAKPSVVQTQIAPSHVATIAAPARATFGVPRTEGLAPVSNVDDTFAAPEAEDVSSPASDLFAGAAPNALASPSLQRDIMRAKVEAQLLGQVDNPVRIGRFVVVDRLGRGAMGVVLRAYDPTLDRKVAIKLVDPSSLGTEIGDAQGRLEREARAAADLSHPNIVTVYDVGRHDAGVFLAMEYVPGKTLTKWMENDAADWRDVCRMFIEVAAGLSAAHDAGIVHRDFKPDNVLVGDDGRPRVADFGLARPVEGWSARDSQRVRGRRPPPSDSALASTGEVCGTPAYMAPEQFSGIDVGPHSDQFGFSASLYEALFRQRPFRGRTLTELAANVLEGRIEALPPDHDVPRPLVAAVLQGLSSSPADRFESVRALSDRLAQIVGARRKRMVWSGAAALATLGLAGGYQVAAAAQIDPCENVHGPIEQAWDETRRGEVKDALAAQPAEVSGPVLSSLDAYAADWRTQRTASCRATVVHGDQSELAHELRMACLDRAAMRMAGITTELTADGPRTDADRLVDLLPPLSACEDVDALERASDRLRTSDMSSQELQAQAEGMALLGRVDARQLLGRPGADELLAQVLQLAQQADLSTLEGLARVELGELAMDAGRYEDARRELEAGVALAVKTAHDDQAARATLELAELMLATDDIAAARLHVGYAEAFRDRVRHEATREHLSSRATLVRAEIELHEGRYEGAQQMLTTLIESLEADRAGAGIVLVSAYDAWARAAKERGELDAAVERWDEALAQFTAVGGGAQTDRVATLRGNLAVGLTLLRRFDEAERHYAVAVDTAQQLHGRGHAVVGSFLVNWGWMAAEQGDHSVARRRIEEGKAILDDVSPNGHPVAAFALEELAELDRVGGDHKAALGKLGQAGQMRDALFGPDHPSVAGTLTTMGHVMLDMGKADKAQGPLGVALELRGKPGVAAVDLGETQLVMALVLRAAGQIEEADALAAKAKRNLSGQIPPSLRLAADLAAWDEPPPPEVDDEAEAASPSDPDAPPPPAPQPPSDRSD